MVKKGLKNTFNQLKKRLVNTFSFRVIILIVLQLTIFMADIFLPFTAATVVAYISIVQITLWLPKSRHTLYSALGSTVFISLGFFLNITDESLLNILINRGLALTAVWVTALFVLRYERSVMKIGESESFKVLFKSASEGLIIVNKWENIVNSNPELSKMFGYSQQELKDKNIKELMPERFWDKYNVFKRKFYRTPQIIHAEEDQKGEPFYGLRKDGREFPVELGIGFYKTVDEILMVVFVVDITKRKETENQLMESKEWLSNFMNSSPSYISILDDQLKIVDCNKRMLEVFDATIKEDVIGKHLAELYPNIKEGEDLEKYKTVLSTGESLTFDKNVKHLLFGQKYYRFSLFKVGKGIGSIIEDITKEKLAGAKITESRERLSNFIDATKQYITILDKDLHIIDCNKPILKMFNVDAKEQVIGKPLADFSPEIGVNGRLGLYEKVLKTGKRVEYDQEVDHPLLGHKYFYIRLFKADHGIGSIIEDVTDKRETEIALKKSEERFTLAQRAANIGSWDWDIPTGNLEWSDTIEAIFGFEPGKFGKTYEAFLDCVHPEDRQFVSDSVNASVEENKDYDIEHRIVWLDKTVHWISEKGDVIRDEKGKAIRMLGIVGNITERKRMEDALLETEETYRITLSNISDAVFVTDDKGNLTFICPNVNIIFGYSVDEVKKLGNISKILGDPIIELNELNSKGEITNIEHKITNKAKEKRLVLINVKKVNIKGGTILYTCHDITKWRQAEEDLLEAHTFVDSIVENLPNVVFVKEPKELRYVKVNKVLEDLIGHKRDDLIGENDYSFFLKKEADFFTKQDREVLKTGKLLDIPRESIEIKNEKRVFHTKKIPILDKKNKPQYLLGISEDITDRVALEEELDISVKRMEATLNASQDAIITVSEDEKIKLFNLTAEKLFGYKLKEVLGKSFSILVPKGKTKKHKAAFTRYLKTGKSDIIGKGSVELRGKKKNGKEFPIELTIGIWDTKEGKIFTAIIRDISKRKQLEKRLEENKIVLP